MLATYLFTSAVIQNHYFRVSKWVIIAVSLAKNQSYLFTFHSIHLPWNIIIIIIIVIIIYIYIYIYIFNYLKVDTLFQLKVNCYQHSALSHTFTSRFLKILATVKTNIKCKKYKNVQKLNLKLKCEGQFQFVKRVIHT